MKAAVCHTHGGPDVLRYEDVADPEIRAHEVLVEVRAIGVQGGDILARAAGPLPATPHVVGYQAAGVIAAVGADVHHLHVGQRVTAFSWAGSHAELFRAPAVTVWPVPDEMAFETAAAIPVEFGTADECLFEFGQLQAGETVLIQAAASGVGICLVQLAKAAGAVVFATASSDDRLQRLERYGVDVAINYLTSDTARQVMAETGGHGVELAVDSIGGASLEASIAALAYRGRISWVGQAGRATAAPSIAGILPKSASINGVFLGAEMRHNQPRVHAVIERLISRVASGELSAVIDSTFPLAEAAAAHRHIESRAAFGRVVLIP